MAVTKYLVCICVGIDVAVIRIGMEVVRVEGLGFWMGVFFVAVILLLIFFVFCFRVIDLRVFGYAVGAEADADRVSLLLKELEGKDILEVIAAGKEKFASVPSGGGGGVVVSAGAGGAAPAAASEEKKEEEKKEEEKEESDDVSFTRIPVFFKYETNCIVLLFVFKSAFSSLQGLYFKNDLEIYFLRC